MAEERTLRLGIDPGPAERGARDFERAGDRVNRAADGMSGRMKVAAAAAAAFGGALALRETVQAIVRMAEVGAAAEETASKYRTVLGPAITETNAFLDEFATKAGLSERAAQDLVATTAAMAQGFGFTRSAAASLATDVTRLAGDLASFNNLPTAEVARSIQSAMAGERESLKRLGIVVMEADVQERALLNTRKASAGQLTQAEKALATYQLVAERAGVAVGDLDRTQDSLANQMKAATAAGVNLRDQVGGLVADALEASGAVGALTESLEGLSDWVDENDDDMRTALQGFLIGLGGAVAAATPMTLDDNLFFDIAKNLETAAYEAKNLSVEAQYLDGIEQSIAERKERQAEAARSVAAAQEAIRAAVRGAAEQADLFDRAMDAGVLSTVEDLDAAYDKLTTQAERLLEISRDETVEYETRVEAAERLLEVEEKRERIASARRITSDIAGYSGRTGAIPGGTGVGSGFAIRMPQISSAIADIITAGLQIAKTNADAAAEAEKQLAAERDAAIAMAVQGVAALADGLFDLSQEARGAIRGVADIVSGIQGLQAASNAEGFAKIAGMVGGIAGVVGGIAGLAGSVIGSDSDRQARAAEQRMAEENRRTLQRNTDATYALARALEGARPAEEFVNASNAARELQAFGGRNRDNFNDWLPGIESILEEFGLDWEEFTEIIDDAGGELTNIGGEFGAQLESVIKLFEKYVAVLAEQEARATDELRVRELIAQGMDEEAAALGRRLAQEDELRRAREAGFSQEYQDYLRSIQAMEDAKAAREAEAEAARKAAEEARQRASFAADVEARGLTLAGQDRDALAVTMQAQAAAELAAAQDMLEAGTISQELFDALAAVLAGELTKALADFDAQAAEAARTLKEAADAERFRAMMDTENLRVRLLVAQGMDDEAFALQQQLQLMEAMEEGRDEEYLAMLRQLHQVNALNRARDAERQAIEDTSRAIDGMTRALNAPAGLPLALHRARTMGVGGGPSFSPNPIQGPAPVNVEQVNIYAQPGQDGRQLFREFMAEANRRGRAGDGFVLPEA